VSGGLDVDVHVVLRVKAPKVDTREARVQAGGEAVTDMTDTRLCLRERRIVLTVKYSLILVARVKVPASSPINEMITLYNVTSLCAHDSLSRDATMFCCVIL